ncbi:MAG: stage II sporulation protein M [Anaerolineae bacterium]
MMTTIPQPIPRRSWTQTFANALIITRREVRDSLRDWRIIAPIIILTFFFPFLAQSAANWIAGFLTRYGAEFIGGQFIPLFLMIVGFFPISISLVIALETFVGEKERLSLEPLLSTPLTNTELYIGKMLAAMIPPMIASFGGMSFYIFLLVQVGENSLPPTMVIVQMYILTFVQALVMVAGSVVVSSQATTTRSANLLASFIIIPMTLVVNGEAIVIFLAPDARSPFGILALWMIAFGMLVVMILLLRVGNSIFNREELLGRMIDNLNLLTIFTKLGRYILAYDDDGTMARNPLEWYTRSIPYSFDKIGPALLITVGVFVVYYLVGWWFGTLPQYQLPLQNTIALETVSTTNLQAGTEQLSFWWILGNNARVLAIGFVLAIITFGVAGYVVVPIVFILLGYIGVQMVSAGYASLYLIGVLPHGIVEIPIIVIATAAMFYVGASITKPPRNQTVGHAWLTALGGAVKLWLGVILPGLALAAFLESTLTIALVQSVLTAGA